MKWAYNVNIWSWLDTVYLPYTSLISINRNGTTIEWVSISTQELWWGRHHYIFEVSFGGKHIKQIHQWRNDIIFIEHMEEKFCVWSEFWDTTQLAVQRLVNVYLEAPSFLQQKNTVKLLL